MRIALATALALILATPSLANDNAALFLAEAEIEAEAAQVETAQAETAQTTPAEAAEVEAASAAPAATAQAFFLADAAARGDVEAPAAEVPAAAPSETRAAAASAAAAGSVQAMVTQAALRHGIDPALAHAVATVESHYRCNAVGRAGELGVMQVKPATARSVGVTGNLRDCATGIEAGMRYLRAALDRHGEGCGGVSAYNMGIHRKASFCNGYGRKVMAQMTRVQVASLD
ncbi:transglycosylase SLT domain-containing protein [Salinarimonas sp.]|uniref:lytic transglycosylase domain-containing protein n=1 Tax=Salinarimonas sp. TaxID=2766526 RepID=UPI0032D99C04